VARAGQEQFSTPERRIALCRKWPRDRGLNGGDYDRRRFDLKSGDHN